MNINQITLIYILSSFTILLFVWTIFQQFSLGKIKKSQKKLFQGKNAQSLEEVILAHQDNLSNLNNQLSALSSKTVSLTALSNTGLNKVGMIRFNPFKNLGGNQSFSIAFLNSHHNGLVISSIYSNDGSRFYSKTIAAGKSQKQYPLTKEEEQAIAIAIGEK